MRVLIIDNYYPAFLKAFYSSRPGLAREGYEAQWRALMDECFGTADFYSRNLKILGHEAVEVVVNCSGLQGAWAREHGLSFSLGLKWRRSHRLPVPTVQPDWMWPTLLAQVEDFKPDVVHVQDPVGTPRAVIAALRRFTRVISTQIASALPSLETVREYDIVLSAFPHFVDRFRTHGIRSAYFRLGFDPSVLPRLRQVSPQAAVFVGGVSSEHRERTRFLELVAGRSSFRWWGYGREHLAARSPLRSRYVGPAWGLDMYSLLRATRISINHHIDVAENFANNMRLFEATGVGSMLLTDHKDNIGDMFCPGEEIVTYRTAEECAHHINYYLSHEAERAAIAARGQARTLKDHTYYVRMRELVELLAPYV